MDGYTLEITTTFFKIDMETGVLLVNEPNLDRDPPSSDRLTFQVNILPFIVLCPKFSLIVFKNKQNTQSHFL